MLLRTRLLCCLSSVRIYKLKANHNPQLRTIHRCKVVYLLCESTNWKQITTQSMDGIMDYSCLSSVRIYKLKANHNICHQYKIQDLLFIFCANLQIESKSQRIAIIIFFELCCLSSVRIYKLKANHNLMAIIRAEHRVVYLLCESTNWKQITTAPVIPIVA